MKAPDEVTKAVSDALALLNGPAWPCQSVAGPCIERETARDVELANKKRSGLRHGWHGYDPARMCPACAAAWHAACAYNFALGVRP